MKRDTVVSAKRISAPLTLAAQVDKQQEIEDCPQGMMVYLIARIR